MAMSAKRIEEISSDLQLDYQAAVLIGFSYSSNPELYVRAREEANKVAVEDNVVPMGRFRSAGSFDRDTHLFYLGSKNDIWRFAEDIRQTSRLARAVAIDSVDERK